MYTEDFPGLVEMRNGYLKKFPYVASVGTIRESATKYRTWCDDNIEPEQHFSNTWQWMPGMNCNKQLNEIFFTNESDYVKFLLVWK